jgi:CheY-like chemotaxis protein
MPYGSVLVVDDVETNLYVAKGLLSPYGLTIDTVESGFEAIDRIKAGNIYDIVYMDHMMPKMDGVEAVKIMRDMGYTHPIVALTANAVAGQAEMFLANGFDGFISKPIDIRQLNDSLNKLICDRKPPEVIEAVRQSMPEKPAFGTVTVPQMAVDHELAEIFVRDAAKTVAELESIYQKRDAFEDEDIQMYIINVHGMKSALANIGEPGLSGVALKLENAGQAGETAVIIAETPAFLASLREIIEKIRP